MHIKKNSNKKEQKASKLRSAIETSTMLDAVATFFDVEDNDVLGYVDNLIRSCQGIGQMKKFSLLSREDALAAIKQLEGNRRVIDANLRAAQALKTLLVSRSDGQDQTQ